MNELLMRAATFEPSTFNAERGTVEAVISAGADVVRRDYQGEFKERLTMSPSAWTTARGTVPVLKDHQRTVDSVIGRAENIRVDGGRALATIKLSDRADLAGTRRDIETGILDSLSFGFTVPKWREFSEGGTRVREAEQVVVHEISFTPLAADPAARTRSSEVTMEETLQTQIRGIAAAVGVQTAFADDLIRRNVSLDDARTAIIQEAARAVPVIDNRAPAITVTRDGGDGLVTRLADGLLSRMDPTHKPEAGRQYAYYRISDIARECLQIRGLNILGSGAELIQRALYQSADFPAVLAESFNKSLLTLRTAPPAIAQIFKRTTIDDFRARHVLEISDGPTLLKMAEDAQLTYGAITDKDIASYSLNSYARGFAISFKALVSDNVRALSDISAKMSRGARNWFGQFLAATVIANPKLTDTNDCFHATHGNLAAAGAAPSDTTVAAAKLAIRKQTDASGAPIEANPKYILIPAALEVTVDKLLATIYPTSSSGAETATRGLVPVVAPQLDAAGSTTAWWLFCDPAEAPVFEYAELTGYAGPQVEVRQGFNTLGSEARIVWHLGSGAVDSRGGYKNAGA